MNKLIIALCLLSPFASAQNVSGANSESESTRASIPRNLLSTFPPVSLGMPALNFRGEPVCDTAGNVYIEIVNPQHLLIGSGPFLGFRLDGKGHTLFAVPDELVAGDKNRGLTSQAVSPGGDYYLLNTNFRRYTLIAYNSDGSERRRLTLNIPARITPEWVAVADSGVSLILGYFDASVKQDQAGRPFAAIFDTSGKLIKNLGSGFQNIDLSSRSTSPLEGDVIAGDDGRFYALNGNAILVFNQSGELLQKINFQKPDPSAAAVRLDISKGIISVKLVRIDREPGKAPIIGYRFILLDSQTGQRRGDYILDPKQFFRYILCFTRNDGYSVYALKEGQAAKQTLPLN